MKVRPTGWNCHKLRCKMWPSMWASHWDVTFKIIVLFLPHIKYKNDIDKWQTNANFVYYKGYAESEGKNHSKLLFTLINSKVLFLSTISVQSVAITATAINCSWVHTHTWLWSAYKATHTQTHMYSAFQKNKKEAQNGTNISSLVSSYQQPRAAVVH